MFPSQSGFDAIVHEYHCSGSAVDTLESEVVLIIDCALVIRHEVLPLTPRTSVEHENSGVDSVAVVEGADLVCFFDTNDTAAPFIIYCVT